MVAEVAATVQEEVDEAECPVPQKRSGRASLAGRALDALIAQPELVRAVRGVPEEFVQLFFIRFHECWSARWPWPDGMVGSGVVERLAWRCADALYAYRRFVSATPGARDSAGAVALLPAELLDRGRHPTADRVREGAEGLLGQGAFAVVEADRLMTLAGDNPGEDHGDLFGVAALLGRLGYLLEPDPRTSSRREQTLVLFRPGEGKPGPLSPLTRDVATLGARVLRALGEQEAREALESPAWARVVTVAGVPASDLARTEARVRWLLATGRSGSGLRARLGRLEEGTRRRLADALTGLVPAMTVSSASIGDALANVWGLLGFAPDDAYAALQDRAAGRSSAALGSVDAWLDPERIARTRRETVIARAAMAPHLAEGEELPPPLPAGLDASHAALLVDLAARSTWPAEEAEALITRHGLMPQAALDRLNELALDAWGEPVLDGVDPVEVHPRAQELVT